MDAGRHHTAPPQPPPPPPGSQPAHWQAHFNGAPPSVQPSRYPGHFRYGPAGGLPSLLPLQRPQQFPPWDPRQPPSLAPQPPLQRQQSLPLPYPQQFPQSPYQGLAASPQSIAANTNPLHQDQLLTPGTTPRDRFTTPGPPRMPSQQPVLARIPSLRDANEARRVPHQRRDDFDSPVIRPAFAVTTGQEAANKAAPQKRLQDDMWHPHRVRERISQAAEILAELEGLIEALRQLSGSRSASARGKEESEGPLLPPRVACHGDDQKVTGQLAHQQDDADSAKGGGDVVGAWGAGKWQLGPRVGEDVPAVCSSAPAGAGPIKQESAKVEEHLTGGGGNLLARAFELDRILKELTAPLQRALNSPQGEEGAALAQLAKRQAKIHRNRRRRTKIRRQVAEALRKERERFADVDRQVDDWRARQLARAIAAKKMKEMHQVAERSAKEQRRRQVEEEERGKVVQRLQELRALRRAKLRRQGGFFPEEDDEFVARVQAAVEAEERQLAVQDESLPPVKDSPAAAELALAVLLPSAEVGGLGGGGGEGQQAVEVARSDLDEAQGGGATSGQMENVSEAGSSSAARGRACSVAVVPADESAGLGAPPGLAADFFHYYFGAQLDLKRLIEVRRQWDAFIAPGGSKIPGVWIKPPPPADATWASYLIAPKF